MTEAATTGALTEAYWKNAGGHAWVELQSLMDRLLQPVGDIVATHADPAAGARVLDVGCGAGATTLDMARRIGPEGRAVGVDVSEPLLTLARRRAQAEGIGNVGFIEADAGAHDFGDPKYDAMISRFGVMFFADPDAAFRNLRRAVRPGGRVTFACWRSAADNPLSLVPLDAAAPFLPEPPPIPQEGPGRFAFADRDHVLGILARSGWNDVTIEAFDTPTPLTFHEMLRLSLQMGVLGTILPGQEPLARRRIEEAVAARLDELAHDGMIAMTAAFWLVRAEA